MLKNSAKKHSEWAQKSNNSLGEILTESEITQYEEFAKKCLQQALLLEKALTDIASETT